MAWREVPLPPCFAGRLGISLDDDELIALDAGRRIYTMDNALKDASLWNWTVALGHTDMARAGLRLPPG